MRIVAVYERSVPMRASMRNAAIAFDEMTTSVLAIETDVVRDGARVIGYGFNSNGRYAQSGLLRERFVRRLLAGRARRPPRSRTGQPSIPSASGRS